jgi:hypothetical protein
MAESRKQQQQQNSRFCCGLRPRHVGLRATLPGLTGQTDPHGQLTADEMGILPSTYGVPFTGGSSLRAHAIGGERYVVPFGGGGSGAASAAPRWPRRVEPRGWRQATRRSAREGDDDDDKSRRWRNSRLSRPVRVRAFAADPIESPSRSAAGGRPARVLLRSVPASRQQGVHRTLLQSKHGVSRRRQAPPAVQQERRCTVHWSRTVEGLTVCCAQCSGQACMCHLLRRQRKAQKRGHSSPCICHLLHCVRMRIPAIP